LTLALPKAVMLRIMAARTMKVCMKTAGTGQAPSTGACARSAATG